MQRSLGSSASTLYSLHYEYKFVHYKADIDYTLQGKTSVDHKLRFGNEGNSLRREYWIIKLLNKSSVKGLYFTHKFINKLIWADVKSLLVFRIFRGKFITLHRRLIKGENTRILVSNCVCVREVWRVIELLKGFATIVNKNAVLL